MRQIQRSLTASELIVAQFMGAPYILRPSSTLNEYFKIEQNAELGDGKYPKLSLLVLGIKGHTVTTGSSGNPSTKDKRHKQRDVTLRKHIPIVIRDLEDDLTAEQRKLFALREVKEITGIKRAVYWAYRLPQGNRSTNIVTEKVRNGELVSTDDFNFSTANIEPPIPEDNVELIEAVADGDFDKVFCPLDITLDPFILNEIINVFRILYPTDDPYISELGYCTSVDKLVSVEGSEGQAITFNEAIGVQIATYVAEYKTIGGTNDTFSASMDFGTTPSLATVSG